MRLLDRILGAMFRDKPKDKDVHLLREDGNKECGRGPGTPDDIPWGSWMSQSERLTCGECRVGILLMMHKTRAQGDKP